MNHLSRALPLAGASNFRDLGGYSGAQGRLVRWRILFRSDHLAALTSSDAELLAELGVARAIDLRGHKESAARAYHLPQVQYLPLPIEPTVIQRAQSMAQAGQTMTGHIARQLMIETYQAFVTHNTPQWTALFDQLLSEPHTPLVFHCTAGKDRTGFGAALILRALGVSQEDVMHDYLLTNTLYQRPAQWLSGDEAVNAAIWGVQPAYLEAAWQAIAAQAGGFEPYLRQQLGISAAAQRQLEQHYLA